MAQVQFQPSTIRFAGEECRGRTALAGTRNIPISKVVCSQTTIQRSPRRIHIHYDPDQETQRLAAKRCEEGLSFAAYKCATRSPTPSPQDRSPSPAPPQPTGLKAKIAQTGLKIKTNFKTSTPSVRLPPTPPATSPLSSTFDEDEEDEVDSGSFLRLPPTPQTSNPSSPLAKSIGNVLRRLPSNTGLFSGINLTKSRSNSHDEGRTGRPQLKKRASGSEDAALEPLARASTSTATKTKKFGLGKSGHSRKRSSSVPN